MSKPVEFFVVVSRRDWEATKANGQHGHWSKQAGARKRLREAAGWDMKALLRDGVFKPLVGPVRCTAYIQYPTAAKADPHNAMGTIKPIVDGCVDAGLLTDDNSEHLIGPDTRRDAGKAAPGTHRIRLVFTQEMQVR